MESRHKAVFDDVLKGLDEVAPGQSRSSDRYQSGLEVGF